MASDILKHFNKRKIILNENLFVDSNILTVLFDDYRSRHPHFPAWDDYIKSKNLGIIVMECAGSNSVYRIVDEKKWLLTKIKYGF